MILPPNKQVVSVAYLENVVLPGVEGLLLVVEFVGACDGCERSAATLLQQAVQIFPEEAEMLVLGGAQSEHGKPISSRKDIP